VTITPDLSGLLSIICEGRAQTSYVKNGEITNMLTFPYIEIKIKLLKRKGGIAMFDYIRKMTLAGAGLAIITTEKIQEMMDDLVKKGEMTEKEARETVNEYVEKSKQAKRDLEDKVEQMITGLLNRMNIPTRKEIEEINERLARLEKTR
jgi:poly(hydroxyalkanoate) granule-associated protein